MASPLISSRAGHAPIVPRRPELDHEVNVERQRSGRLSGSLAPRSADCKPGSDTANSRGAGSISCRYGYAPSDRGSGTRSASAPANRRATSRSFHCLKSRGDARADRGQQRAVCELARACEPARGCGVRLQASLTGSRWEPARPPSGRRRGRPSSVPAHLTRRNSVSRNSVSRDLTIVPARLDLP